MVLSKVRVETSRAKFDIITYFVTMPYKIIQTFEKGRPMLTAVPHEWEANGILHWPKKHEKLRKIENSTPEGNWRQIKCILKRSNLLTLTEAEYELDKMSNLSDTENDTENYLSREPISITNKQINNLQQSYNVLARECLMESHPVNENVITEVTDSHTLQDMIVINSRAPQPVMTNSEILTPTPNVEFMTADHTGINKSSVSHVILSENCTPFLQDTTTSNTIGTNEALVKIMQKLDQVQEEVKTLTRDMKTISDNQQTLYENQNSLLLKFSEHQTQFEEFVKLSCKPKGSAPDICDFKPIANENELQNLESLLKDPDFKSRLISKIEVVCSKGKNRGMNNAYALSDIIFQRQFLTNCSWAGGSRTDQTKIALKSYTNIFNLLFSVCHESDPDFKKPDCESFIKTILKNAHQRLNSKQIRTSTKRHRQKGQKKNSTAPTSKKNGKMEIMDGQNSKKDGKMEIMDGQNSKKDGKMEIMDGQNSKKDGNVNLNETDAEDSDSLR